jgi:hypothetical protein
LKGRQARSVKAHSKGKKGRSEEKPSRRET